MLACVQGSSDSLIHSSHGGEAVMSIFGIAVRVLLRATSLPHCMVYSPARAEDCLSLPVRVVTLPLRFSCSEVQVLPVLLSYYVTSVISCGPGALSSWSSFLGCLSGSSELAWGSVVPLRIYKVRCSASGCALHPCSASAGHLGLFHAMSFPGSLSWSGGVVSFAFVTSFVAKTQAPPLLLGLRASLYQPNQWETVISRAGGQVFPGSLRLRIGSDASGSSFAARYNWKELSKTSVSF